jgi:CBS domain-containing protein
MRAVDLMTKDVLAFAPDDSVREIAAQLAGRGISGAPVVDDTGAVVGMVSEGDLLRRTELGTELRRSWWMDLLADNRALAQDFARTHGRLAHDVMTREVISISENTPIAAIANLMERHRIKRLPVLRDGRLVGIVSRADIIRCLSQGEPPAAVATGGQEAFNAQVHARVMHALSKAGWAARPTLEVAVVENGMVEISGTVSSAEEKRGIEILVEEVPGVTAVRDLLLIESGRAGSALSGRGPKPVSGPVARGPSPRKRRGKAG